MNQTKRASARLVRLRREHLGDELVLANDPSGGWRHHLMGIEVHCGEALELLDHDAQRKPCWVRVRYEISGVAPDGPRVVLYHGRDSGFTRPGQPYDRYRWPWPARRGT